MCPPKTATPASEEAFETSSLGEVERSTGKSKEAKEGRNRTAISTWSGRIGLTKTKSKVPFRNADQRSVPVTLEQSEALCVIRLDGEINIGSAAELKKLLLQALASGRELRVDLEGATELDVTALQLLWAAEREARGSGRGFTLAGRVPEEISAAVSDAGFEKFPLGVDPK